MTQAGKIYRFCPHCGQPVRPGVDGAPSCEPCGASFYRNPVPAVAVVVADPAGRVLLVQRAREPGRGLWSLPGGFMEIDESPDQAARRELAEETGLEAGPLHLIGVADEPSQPHGRVVVVCYQALTWRGNPRAGDDAVAAGFFAPKATPTVAFRCHQRFIERWQSLTRRE